MEVASLMATWLPGLFPDPNNSLELDSKLQFICYSNQEASFRSLNDVMTLEIKNP
jgi:hypothetical protein